MMEELADIIEEASCLQLAISGCIILIGLGIFAALLGVTVWLIH